MGVLRLGDWTVDDGASSGTFDTARLIDVRGNPRAGTDGDMDGVTLTIAGDPDARQVLARLAATGDVMNTQVNITGDAGSIDFSRGTMSNVDINVASELRLLRLGQIDEGEPGEEDDTDVNVTADDLGNVQAVRWVNGNLIATTVRTLRTTGNRRDNILGDLIINAEITGEPGAPVSDTVLRNAFIAGTFGGMWNIAGSTGPITVGSTSSLLTALITGDVRTLNSRGDSAGTLSALSIGGISIRGNMLAGSFTAGYTAGPDNMIRTADDVIIGGDDAFIRRITVNGTTPATPPQTILFTAGSFPRFAFLNRERVDPLTDDRFSLTPA
jgi:hypothetical protein